MGETELAARAQSVIARLAAIPGRIAQLTAGWSDQELRAAPGDEAWSAGQIFAHLRSADDILAYRAYAILVRDDTPLLPIFDEHRWADVAGYVEMDFGLSLRTFAARREELVYMLRRVAPADWERKAVREQLGQITLLEGMILLIEHEEEHCLEIETIRRIHTAKG